MAERLGLIERLVHRGAMRWWSRATRQAASFDFGALRARRSRARALHHKLGEFLIAADSRLARPRIGSTAFPRPLGTDWSWRPELWRGRLQARGIAAARNRAAVGSEVTIFHDCEISELTLRQTVNNRPSDLAPFGLRLDMFRFDGSFLGLVIDLPADAAQGLRKRHLLRADVVVDRETPVKIVVRLNVMHGPNTEQFLADLPEGEGGTFVEFDLAYSKLNEKRVDKLWVDLIFENPEMNEVTLRDVTFCRYPRAEI